LRISPKQKFFPLPNEVAAEIDEFWRWAPEWMAITGCDEAELLSRFPSFKGTKEALI
jgi:hypothetical protein